MIPLIVTIRELGAGNQNQLFPFSVKQEENLQSRRPHRDPGVAIRETHTDIASPTRQTREGYAHYVSDAAASRSRFAFLRNQTVAQEQR
jgi:hypothetical protein